MFSSSISDTDTALASQYNNLRLDIFDQTSGHAHDGTSTGGKKVAHSNLTDGAIPNTYLSHSTISKHVQGTDGYSSDPDEVGGDEGVHGLASGVKVAGSLGNKQLLVDGGYKAASSSGTVTFSTGFSAAPYVGIAVEFATGTPADQGVRITGRTASGFTYATSGGVAFTWIAVGT